MALAAGAGVLFGRAAAAVTPEARFVSALSALVDLLGASVVAGAGLLAASWRGLRLGILDAMSGHPLHWIAAAILLLGVNALAVRLLDARKRVARAERPERR